MTEAKPRVAHSLSYIPGFDGLRGIAVFAVILHHANAPGFRGGFIGVDVFFVLSGFLITRILQAKFAKDGQVSFKYFYSRRARRILPALWTMFAVLTVAVLIDPSYIPHDAFFHSLGIAFVFLTQWQIIMGDICRPLLHLWSLGWEENFYLVWPLVFAFFGRRTGWKPLFRLSVLFIALLTAMRLAVFWLDAPIPSYLFAAAYFRVDTIMLGCALALATHPSDRAFGKGSRAEEALSFVALAGLCGMFLIDYDNYFWGGGFSVVALATFILANHLRKRPESRVADVLELLPIRWTGLISYGLYLWHYPVIEWVNQRGLSKPVSILSSVVLAYAIAALSYYSVEAWFRKAPAAGG